MTSDGPVVQSSPKSAGAFQLQVSPGLSRLSPEKGCTRNSLFVQDERRLAKSPQFSSVLHGRVFRSKSIGIGLQCFIPFPALQLWSFILHTVPLSKFHTLSIAGWAEHTQAAEDTNFKGSPFLRYI
jgi:hypothetical protein